MSKKIMAKEAIDALISKGIEGYNELIYRLIIIKDFKKAHKYANEKMDLIIDKLLDMSDEDVALLAYTSAMTKDYESARNCFKVLYKDGDAMKDEEHFNLFASVASALCYFSSGDENNAQRMLEHAISIAPDKSHFGADEVVLKQVDKLIKKELI